MRGFWQALAQGLLINAMLREMFLLLLLLLLFLPGAWYGMSAEAPSAIAMRREMFLRLRLLPLRLLLPGAWRGMSKEALSAIAMPREMFLFPLLPLPGA